ncbi:hypothetical protein ACJQWK_07779 [Exserohilum turcicum]
MGTCESASAPSSTRADWQSGKSIKDKKHGMMARWMQPDMDPAVKEQATSHKCDVSRPRQTPFGRIRVGGIDGRWRRSRRGPCDGLGVSLCVAADAATAAGCLSCLERHSRGVCVVDS